MNPNVELFLEYINESNDIVFFGGAGVSTESGIPDFRSKDGLYNQHDVRFEKYKPEDLLHRNCLYHNPKVFFEFYRQKMDTRGYEPNVAHRVIAKLEQMGKLNAVITQNIDGLHQKAGSKNVLEIHGTTLRNYCTKCGKEHSADFIFESKDVIPRCECGGMVRPDVTLYGEQLPQNAMFDASEAMAYADMLIVAGTSLSVYPAAGLLYDLRRCNHIVLLNIDDISVPFMGKDDLFIKGPMGETFAELEKYL